MISGGRRIIPSWTRGRDGVWTTQLPKDLRFEQLWINGRRGIRARHPDRFFHYLLRVKEDSIDNGRRARQSNIGLKRLERLTRHRWLRPQTWPPVGGPRVRLEIGWKLDRQPFEDSAPVFFLSFGNPF